MTDNENPGFTIRGLSYFTLYMDDLPAAVDFYTRAFGAPQCAEGDSLFGWKLGRTWLTLFPSKGSHYKSGNPRNAEFAIEVSAPEEVDRLWAHLIEEGATKGWEPKDTEMYDPMRFSYVMDPFGTTLDIYCPLEKQE